MEDENNNNEVEQLTVDQLEADLAGLLEADVGLIKQLLVSSPEYMLNFAIYLYKKKYLRPTKECLIPSEYGTNITNAKWLADSEIKKSYDAW